MATNAPRAILISYTIRPTNRVVEYAHFLRENGLDVDLVVWDPERWLQHSVELPPDVRLHAVKDIEARLFVRRVESLAVRRIPGGVLRRVKVVVDSNPVTRPLDPAVSLCERAHQRVAGAVHGRVFLPYYRLVRPRALGRATDKALRGVNFGNVVRIVATDIHSITCAWRLARRFPNATVLSNLDRHLDPGKAEPAGV